MWWWIIPAVIAAIITGLVFLPVGVRVRYEDDLLKIWYTLGPVRLHYYPEQKTAREKKITVRTVLNEPIKVNRKYDTVLGDFLAELKTTLELLWFLRPRLRVKRLELHLHLAGDNPCSVALEYGGAWAAIGGVMPVLEEAFIIKKRDLTVDCDFSGGSTSLEAKLDITIGLGRLLWCLVRYSLDTINKAEQKDQKHTERRS